MAWKGQGAEITRDQYDRYSGHPMVASLHIKIGIYLNCYYSIHTLSPGRYVLLQLAGGRPANHGVMTSEEARDEIDDWCSRPKERYYTKREILYGEDFENFKEKGEIGNA